MKIEKRTILLAVLALMGIELLSFLGYLVPSVGILCFVLICLGTLMVSLKALHWGLIPMLSELMLGSHGYLFFLPLGSVHISLRMGIFCMVLCAYGYHLWKEKAQRDFLVELVQQPLVWLIFAVLGFAGVQGILQGNAWSSVYTDGNAFLYILLTPVLFKTVRSHLSMIVHTVIAGLVIQSGLVLCCALTFFYRWPFMGIWYKWIRDLRVGEITLFTDGWVRVFFQSQIYVLLGLFVFWMVWLFYAKAFSRRGFRWFLCLGMVLGASLILSFSRSFWIGLVVGVGAYSVVLFTQQNRWLVVLLWRNIALTFVSGLLLIFCLYHLPGGMLWGDLFQRLQPDGSEAAVASRWALLKPLWQEVSAHWFWGKGFGSQVTYVSADPRLIAESHGVVTTFAFEWGFLDWWLKTGIVGMLLLLYVGILLMVSLLREKRPEYRVLAVTVGVLFVVHFFTPYLNHPLGLAYMAVLGGLVYKERRSTFS